MNKSSLRMKQGDDQGRLEAWEVKDVFEFACALTGHWGATQGGCAADDVDGWTLADGSATCAPTKPAAQRVAGSAIVFNKKKEKPDGRAGTSGGSNIAFVRGVHPW